MASNTKISEHETVLLQQAVDQLALEAGGLYVDATFGRGGHSREILERNNNVFLIGCDRDPDAQQASHELVEQYPDAFMFRKQNISELQNLQKSQQPDGRAIAKSALSGVLMDLGISSPQIDRAERGFSFQKDGPLDMRMDNTQGQTAADVVNTEAEEDLANIFFKYGDEKRSRKIARAIGEKRAEQVFTTTKELADLIAATLGWKEKSQHPATRCFQALRIYVNKELEELEQGLAAAIEMIKPGGRLVVISFHSLEDRIVKHFFQPPKKELLPGIPLEVDRAELPFVPVGKPIKPSPEEVSVNPRSRSAIMRVGVRT